MESTSHPTGDLVGRCMGSYRLVRFISGGSMGEVYEAEHLLLSKRAAVKVALAEISATESGGLRFFKEARVAARMRHPGLTEVYDYGHDDSGRAYIVMELAEGENLAELVDGRGSLPPAEATRVAGQIAQAMRVAHAAGTIHRDLKPENIVLAADGAVKVLDFGIAKISASASLAGLPSVSREGEILGTPAFMAPEQCRGDAPVDERADIYSLGCVLFFMLTGRPPFVTDGVAATLGAHIFEAPPLASSLIPLVPPALDELVARLLAKSPDERPQTMADVQMLLADLELRPNAPVVIFAAVPAQPFGRPASETDLVPLPPHTLAHLLLRGLFGGLAVVALAVIGWRVLGEDSATASPVVEPAAAVRPAAPVPPPRAPTAVTPAEQIRSLTGPVVTAPPRAPTQVKTMKVDRTPRPRPPARDTRPAERPAEPGKKRVPPPRVSVDDGALNPFDD